MLSSINVGCRLPTRMTSLHLLVANSTGDASDQLSWSFPLRVTRLLMMIGVLSYISHVREYRGAVRLFRGGRRGDVLRRVAARAAIPISFIALSLPISFAILNCCHVIQDSHISIWEYRSIIILVILGEWNTSMNITNLDVDFKFQPTIQISTIRSWYI